MSKKEEFRQRIDIISQIVNLDDQPASGQRFFERTLDAYASTGKGLTGQDFITTDIPKPITDEVDFSVTCPLTVAPQEVFLLDVWAHPANVYQEILDYVCRDPRMRTGANIRSKGPFPVTRGTTLIVKLKVPDFELEDEDSV